MERRDARVAIRPPVLAGEPRVRLGLAHRLRELGPVVGGALAAVEEVHHRRDPPRLGLDEGDLQIREAVERATQDELPQRATGEERVLGREHHERGEDLGLVVGCAGTAVLAERQADLLARGPDRVERGIEEELRAGIQRRHQDADETLLLGPVDVLHRLVDVVERHQRLPVQPARRLGAEVDHPAVERHVGLAGLLRVGRVVDAAGGERRTVREEDLGRHALGLEVGDRAACGSHCADSPSARTNPSGVPSKRLTQSSNASRHFGSM